MKWPARSGTGHDFRRSPEVRRQIDPLARAPDGTSGFPCSGKDAPACVNGIAPLHCLPVAMHIQAPSSSFSPLLPEHLLILRSGRWFHELPRALAQQLAQLARVQRLAPGEALFRRGDPPDGLHAVLRGTLRMCGAGTGGRSRGTLLALLEAPAWFGELSLFDQSPRSHDVVAVEASSVLQVPQAPLLQWLQQHPEHWQPLALLLTLRVRQTLANLEEQSLLAAPQRLARRLVSLAIDHGQRLDSTQSRRVLHLSQEQLAQMLALSRQTTNQILQDLQQRGLIRLHRGRLEILDLPGLRASTLAEAP